jgi:hypothetical protein
MEEPVLHSILSYFQIWVFSLCLYSVLVYARFGFELLPNSFRWFPSPGAWVWFLFAGTLHFLPGRILSVAASCLWAAGFLWQQAPKIFLLHAGDRAGIFVAAQIGKPCSLFLFLCVFVFGYHRCLRSLFSGTVRTSGARLPCGILSCATLCWL